MLITTQTTGVLAAVALLKAAHLPGFAVAAAALAIAVFALRGTAAKS